MSDETTVTEAEQKPYAIFKASGTQFFVQAGEVLKIDKVSGVGRGDTLTFDEVLAVGGAGGEAKFGVPLVSGGKVTAEVVGQTHNKKIHVQKFKRRKGYKKHKGHRQPMTEIRITDIVG